ncbi:hypothetical protein [uncultured Brevibacillus sp.]|uniref:hypothetical protein n=1 Tax=uncultured Brevibacillus sp. TaxID=169970 RepID=UPI002599B925|nr:hypothetical protein [uncultured Brevibacillus sp.]
MLTEDQVVRVTVERDILLRLSKDIDMQLEDQFATSVTPIIKQFNQLDEINMKLKDLNKERAAEQGYKK